MKILMAVIIFLMIGALFIVSEGKLALKDQDSREELGSRYYSWFGKLFGNSKNIIGSVVKLSWLPNE